MLNAVAGKRCRSTAGHEYPRLALCRRPRRARCGRIAERGRAGETYLIGARAEMRNIDLARAICRLLDARHPERGPHARLISFVTDRPGHDARYAIDPGKIERELGWRPRLRLRAGLAAPRSTGISPTRRGAAAPAAPIGRSVSAPQRRREAPDPRRRRPGGARAGRRAGSQGKSLARAACDITDRAAVAQALSAPELSAVVNCAAYTAVDRAESEPELAFAVNAEGAGIVARAAADRGLPVIHLSTDYVYAGTAPSRIAKTRRSRR